MCGLAGFAGIKDNNKKEILTIALGLGIDTRGGDAAGYFGLKDGRLTVNKRKGEWLSASQKFFNKAIDNDILALHSRFATCSTDEVKNAHPFSIKRGRHTRLHGMHNGIIPSAWDSAEANGREINVDSEEIFQLIADENYDGLRKLSGYGVALWIDTSKKDHINLVRLSEDSEIVMYRLREGGIAWASTSSILKEALKSAGLKIKSEIDLSAIGTVFNIYTDEIYTSELTGLVFKKYNPMRFFGSFSPFNFENYGGYKAKEQSDLEDLKQSEYDFITNKFEKELELYESNKDAQKEIRRLYEEQLQDLFGVTEEDETINDSDLRECLALNDLL